MQILLADAKIMREWMDREPEREPRFQVYADMIAEEMACMDIEELSRQLKCNHRIAAEVWRRYHEFKRSKKMPAILAYNGQAYKHLRADTLNEDALRFGQEHLWITSFLYGMLRPMDGIVAYRMEHNVRLDLTEEKPVGSYWRDKLTDVLIESVKEDDGILVHLATVEYEHLFDWKRICREVKVIQPQFYVRQKDGEIKIQAVWAKTCRGAMVRMILERQIAKPEEILSFAYEGFEYMPESEENHPHYIRAR